MTVDGASPRAGASGRTGIPTSRTRSTTRASRPRQVGPVGRHATHERRAGGRHGLLGRDVRAPFGGDRGGLLDRDRCAARVVRKVEQAGVVLPLGLCGTYGLKNVGPAHPRNKYGSEMSGSTRYWTSRSCAIIGPAERRLEHERCSTSLFRIGPSVASPLPLRVEQRVLRPRRPVISADPGLISRRVTPPREIAPFLSYL